MPNAAAENTTQVRGFVTGRHEGPGRGLRSASPVEGARRIAPALAAWAETVLRLQRMPPAEVRTLMSATDPELVHRLLELHVERLEERYGADLRKVAAVERILSQSEDGTRKAAPHLGRLEYARAGSRHLRDR
jgi:hypothetical protein